MLAPMVTLGAVRQVATHVTYLAELGAGQWGKAPVMPAKRIFGGYRGAVVPLTRGEAGRALRELEPGERVLIAEGIENALAGAAIVGGRAPRTWAAGSLGNLAALALPVRGLELVLVADPDEGNDAAAALFQRAVAHLVGQGARVDILRAPAGDMADYVREAYG
jgi:hypothetical protein